MLAVFIIVALLSFTLPSRAAQAATRFVLARTIQSPTATGGGFFGEAVAVVGDSFIVGARGECAPICGGAVHLFDSNGNPARTIVTPSLFASFGASVGGVGADPLVGAIMDRTAGPNAGAAYLFDDATGDLLQTFLNPNPAPDPSGGLDFFGQAVEGFGDDILVSAPGEHLGAQDAGVVYLFDGATGALLQTFQKPNPAAFDQFGVAVATVGNNIAVGAAYLFDGMTAELTATLLNPERSVTDSFAWQVAAIGDNLLVSSLFQSSNPAEISEDGVA